MSLIRKIFPVISLFILIYFSGCDKSGTKKGTDPESITVFAAAGTRMVSEEICKLFESSTGIRVECNYASSGILARQISEGAPGDLFISANRKWIDYLSQKDLFADNSIYPIARNRLVVICPTGSDIPPPVFSPQYPVSDSIRNKIAIGDPSYVPVGSYAKKVFDTLGWYEALSEKTILGKDVSSVQLYVEMKECDWAIVYHSEAIFSEKVKIIATIPDSLYEPIVFYMGRLSDNPSTGQLAELFISDSGQNILSSFGFLSTTATE